MKGARKAVRTSIMKAIWMFWMSVVSRVTREAEENRSMFPKENSWIWQNTSWRRFRAKPQEARAQVIPAT